MNGLNIYLADGTLNGPIIMSSSSSFFGAVRTKRMDIPNYVQDLSYPGVYMLLIGNDTVYVGQSGLNTIAKRVVAPHSGNIDSLWHTVLGFTCKNQTISNNELLFIENALCEFAHANYKSCVTNTPAKANCNAAYRNKHYNLSSSQIHTCNQYIKDIKHYIASFGSTIFGAAFTSAAPAGQTELFYYKNLKKGVDAKAEIIVHNGNTAARTTVVKAGSIVSSNVSPHFSASNKVIQDRNNLTAQGKLVAGVLQTDVSFSSQSAAGQFVSGRSFDGNREWKTVNGNIPLKNLLV